MRLPTVNSFIHAFLLVQLVRRAAARSFSFKAVNQRGCLYPALEMRKIRSKNLLGNLAPFSAPLAVLLSSPFSLFFFYDLATLLGTPPMVYSAVHIART